MTYDSNILVMATDKLTYLIKKIRIVECGESIMIVTLYVVPNIEIQQIVRCCPQHCDITDGKVIITQLSRQYFDFLN